MDFIAPNEFNTKNLSFGKAITQTAGTHRVMIQYQMGSQNKAPLFVITPKLFSFGVSPQAAMGDTLKDDHSNVTGYTLPLVLFNHQTGASPEEQQFIDFINAIVNEVKNFCVTKEFNSDIGRYGEDMFTAADMKKLNPIYVKKEKGVPVPGKSPMLYPKLKHKTTNNSVSFATIFNENNDRYTTDTSVQIPDVNPSSLIGNRMHCKAKLHVESIFIGSRISIQLKISQVLYELVDQAVPIRIAPFNSTSTTSNGSTPPNPISNDLQNTKTNTQPIAQPIAKKQIQLSDDEDDDDLTD